MLLIVNNICSVVMLWVYEKCPETLWVIIDVIQIKLNWIDAPIMPSFKMTMPRFIGFKLRKRGLGSTRHHFHTWIGQHRVQTWTPLRISGFKMCILFQWTIKIPIDLFFKEIMVVLKCGTLYFLGNLSLKLINLSNLQTNF